VKCGGGRGGTAPSTGFEGKGDDDIVVCPPSIPFRYGDIQADDSALLRLGWVDFGVCCFGFPFPQALKEGGLAAVRWRKETLNEESSGLLF
jgi:hypothetical protein